MCKKGIVYINVILFGIALIARAEDSGLDLSQRFLLLATTRTSTLQKELDAAAAAGYRVLVASSTRGAEAAMIVEKVASPPHVYQYVLLATSRTSTMERELNEQAARGFRLLPRTMIDKGHDNGELVMILERAPAPSQTRYQYRLLATTRTGTLQREMAQAVGDGYTVVGMFSRGEHIVILEKPTP
jgi:hypothetical protein